MVYQEKEENSAKLSSTSSYFSTLFLSFRKQLDEQNDRRERVIHLSRSITKNSKKVIFASARAPYPYVLSSPVDREIEEHWKRIEEEWRQLSEELSGPLDFYRYFSSISPAVQEYVEAVATHGYVKEKRILSLEEIRQRGKEKGMEMIRWEVKDYLLGLADVTGELMKIALADFAQGRKTRVHEIVDTLYTMIEQQLELGVATEKRAMMESNKKKVEQACYMVKLRESEFSEEEMKEYCRRFGLLEAKEEEEQ